MDLKSIGVSPRRFEPCRLRVVIDLSLQFSVPIIVPSKAVYSIHFIFLYELLLGSFCEICCYIKRNKPTSARALKAQSVDLILLI